MENIFKKNSKNKFKQNKSNKNFKNQFKIFFKKNQNNFFCFNIPPPPIKFASYHTHRITLVVSHSSYHTPTLLPVEYDKHNTGIW